MFKDKKNALNHFFLLKCSSLKDITFTYWDLLIIIYNQGLARTQSPTLKNYVPEMPTFGAFAGFSPTRVQWKGLNLGRPPF